MRFKRVRGMKKKMNNGFLSRCALEKRALIEPS